MTVVLQGRSGEIKHLYRSFAFLLSRMMTENGGYFVCKTRHLVQAGGAKVSKLLKYISRLLKIHLIYSQKKDKRACTLDSF